MSGTPVWEELQVDPNHQPRMGPAVIDVAGLSPPCPRLLSLTLFWPQQPLADPQLRSHSPASGPWCQLLLLLGGCAALRWLVPSQLSMNALVARAGVCCLASSAPSFLGPE